MPPELALFLWFVLLTVLLRFDPAKPPGITIALWVPLIWIFIIGSRLPSQWLGGELYRAAEAMEEGNALDRAIYFFLILIAIGVLLFRSFPWAKVINTNLALSSFLLFALISVTWSDFPFVAFKRWFRDLGTYLVIFVALSEPHSDDAISMLFRRLCILLIPLSIVLNKYFPALAREYSQWTGQGYFIGATTSKNMLGVLCLISGLYFFWDTLARWRDQTDSRKGWTIGMNLVFLLTTLWLIGEADSATSKVCLLLGCIVIAMAHTKTVKRHPIIITVLIPLGIISYLLLEFVFGVNVITALAESVGRNADLTDRTNIWSAVLSTDTNPIVGTGYESFWLGPRLQYVWGQAGRVNEAHNGYLEVYLNLGIIGLILLATFLVSSYRTICRRFRLSATDGSLGLALWTVLLFYNVTESAFKVQLLWVAFLLNAIDVPLRRERSNSLTAPAG